MLIKKQLLTIKPKAPMAKNRKAEKKFYCYATVENDILAVFIYKYETNELIYRFFCDGKNYIVYDGEEWNLKNPADYVGWYNGNYYTQYYKNSSSIIKNYLNGYSEGVDAIGSWISTYNYEKRETVKTNRQKRIDDKINSFPDMKEQLKPYCDEKIFPSYLFMTKINKKGKRSVVCSHCSGKYQVSGVKHRETGVCKKCNREGIYYLRTYNGPTDKCKLLVCNKTTDGKYTAFQWLKVERSFDKELKAKYRFDDYFYAFQRPDGGTDFYKYNYSFWHWGKSHYWNSYHKVYVYSENLNEVLNIKNIPPEVWENIKRPIYFYDVLLNLKEYPATEYLLKSRLYSLASNEHVCNQEQRGSLAKFLGINGQYIPIMQKLDVNYFELQVLKHSKVFLNEGYVARLQQIMRSVNWQDFDIHTQSFGMTEKKAITYFYNQMQKTKVSADGCMKWYKDYKGMCTQMNIELSNKGLKYPPNIKFAHDQIMEKVQIRESRAEKVAFMKACNELYKKYISWHDDKYIVVRPQCRKDFVREGQILSHCVGSSKHYYENHKKGTAVILFIRSIKNTDKPLYTLELDCKDFRIKQLYGKKDVKAPAEVFAFVKKYIKEIKKNIKNKKENAA